MQVDSIKLQDYMRTDEASGAGVVAPDNAAKKADKAMAAGEPLRAVSVDSAFYNKTGQFADELKKDLSDAETLDENTVNQIENIKHSWDTTATKEAMEDGIDPLDADTQTLVTVVDEIKMNIAKGGGDISKMGGLSDAEIEAMSGSIAQAMAMEQGLTETLPEEAQTYLVKNELEPTLSNIYNATYSAPQKTGEDISDDEVVKLLTDLGDKLDEIISQVEGSADIVENPEEIKELCGEMLKNEIPITNKNIDYMLQLQNYEKPQKEEIEAAISDIILEGKEPKDAYLIPGYSLMDQAREAVSQVNSVEFEQLFEDVSSRRQLEEVRISMTVEATFTMMKNGVEVDTTNLQKLIDDLKSQERSLLDILMKGETKEKTAANVNLFEETMSQLADINSTPNYWLGSFSNINAATFSEVHTVSVSVSVEFSKMQETYEAVGTEVRKDLGDSMTKAFSNVDDILQELGLETTESNEKAVRILAYNQMEITEDSVVSMKASSEFVERTFRNMTPKVVTEMIKRGDNPLDMTISELKDKTEELKAEVGTDSEDESFARFLYKAEHSGQISAEEKESYIGIYRLLHQVQKHDGAAIGALINQGSEVTLRNLMTAVRSAKHSGREYEVSDKTGVVEDLLVNDLSITEQVEKVFLTNRCKDAIENMTPNKMQELGEDTFMEMNPDQFAIAMEEIPDTKGDEAYAENITTLLKKALEVDKDVLRVMDNFDIPKSANLVSAVQQLMSNSNKAVRKLFENYASEEQLDIHDLIDEAYSRFAESCKTPEEMAEAQEALGELAENVMKTMIVSQEVDEISFNDMRMVVNQYKAMGQMASNEETFHIPIMIQDEAGNMNLKIVRGNGESGLIKMALYLESTGTVTTSFKYENNKVNGNITCETAQMRSYFEGRANEIAAQMQEETGFEYTFSFVQNQSVNVNEVYQREVGISQEKNQKNNEIQTKSLYGIAKSFIQIVGSMS